MRTLKSILLCSALVCVSFVQAFAGWVIRTSDADGTGETVAMYQKGMMRMDMGEAVSIILNTGNNTLTWIFHPAGKYWSGSPEEFRKQQKEMIREMTGVDPDQVESLEKEDFTISIEKAGSEQILGYSVDHYKISKSGELREELWIAPGIVIMTEDERKKLEKLLDAMSEEEEKDYTDTPEYESLMMNGYPLKSIDYLDGEIMSREEVQSVENRDIPEAEFSVPGNYEKAGTVTEFFKYMYDQQ